MRGAVDIVDSMDGVDTVDIMEEVDTRGAGASKARRSQAGAWEREAEDLFDFIERTYGCMRENPIYRGEQGAFDIREAMQ